MKNTHSADTDLLRDFGLLVDINLVKLDVGIRSRQLLEDGGDNTARATPCSPEVKDGHSTLVDLQFANEIHETMDSGLT